MQQIITSCPCLSCVLTLQYALSCFGQILTRVLDLFILVSYLYELLGELHHCGNVDFPYPSLYYRPYGIRVWAVLRLWQSTDFIFSQELCYRFGSVAWVPSSIKSSYWARSLISKVCMQPTTVVGSACLQQYNSYLYSLLTWHSTPVQKWGA